MNRNLTLAARLREVFLDGMWIANTNYQHQLRQISWQQAVHKPGSLNSIAALTYHINYYLAGLLQAFDEGKLSISDRYSFDVPDIQSAEEWDQLVSVFLRHAELFSTHVGNMPDALFDEPFIDEKYGSYLRNIEGVIEHSYYHLGQISLLRKIVTITD